MIKRDEAHDGVWNRTANDEPVFILRANDELAPFMVREWAYRYYEQKGRKISERQLKKYNEAMRLATQMEIWKKGHG